MNKKDNDDIRKDIEELEKLIENVRKQNEEEKKKLNIEDKKPRQKVIKINLAQDYSTNNEINLIVGFLVNFILFFLIIEGFKLATTSYPYLYLGFAAVFTLFEYLMKRYLFKKHVALVIYTSGLIFFLFNLLFIYAVDLLLPLSLFSFENYLYPLVFVFLFQIIRFIIKQLYLLSVTYLSRRFKKGR